MNEMQPIFYTGHQGQRYRELGTEGDSAKEEDRIGTLLLDFLTECSLNSLRL